jgi:hypothetical protein
MPIVSWYEDMNDSELLREALLLERLAYEEDVRKVLRRLNVNNEIDQRFE